MPFQVDFKRRCHRDLDEQLAWWCRHGKAAAERWREDFLAKVLAALESDPHCYPEADEAGDLGKDLRMMLYGRRRQSYRVLFTVSGNRVTVHRVRHSAQDRLTKDDFQDLS